VTPVVARTRAELSAALAPVRRRGRIALVPTMGALHEGHRSLVVRARGLADTVVVSIFVNPLQFGPGDDLARYPRTLDDDLAMCEQEGVAVVFTPAADVVYPDGEPLVRVDAGPLGSVLEGAVRPGHFDGVLTVVLKLFGLVRPDVAVFGEKDAQQLALLRLMVRDLDVPVRVEAAPTVREPDGLALSSRNRYLSPEQRRSALALSRALRDGAAAAGHGPAAVLAAAMAVLAAEPGADVDYVELVDPASFQPVPARARGPALLVVAARIGSTRLIDNTGVLL
jgi:pantoate--beta-alanine ligase